MGKSIQILADNISLIASPETWIEGKAIQQLTTTATLPGMKHVAGMPDLHPGRGYPIGAAFFSQQYLYPALVGNDIGCGMSLWQSDLSVHRFSAVKAERKLSDVEQPLGDDWQATLQDIKQRKSLHDTHYDHALGTIGGGNHFAEFQQVDEIIDNRAAQQLSLDASKLQLLVHSGSRGVGQSILQQHVRQFGHAGLMEQTCEADSYLAQHRQALCWAEVNRELIARRFLAAIRTQGQCLTDVNHNLVEPCNINGQQGWLHRKGASPSDQGVLVIPGSRGDYSWLVQPMPDECSLFSLAHGAGRKWNRSDCKDRLSHRYKQDDLLKTRLGSRVICGVKSLLYEEAPQAYKPSESIIGDLVDAGLIRVIARLKPVLTFKTHGECC